MKATTSTRPSSRAPCCAVGRRSRYPGFSLPEVLAAAFLLLVTLGLVAQVLVPSAILLQVGTARTSVEQGPMVVIHTLQRALMNAQAETVTMLDSSPAVSFVEIVDNDPFDAIRGAPRLRGHFTVIWYDAIVRKVFSKQWPPDIPALTGYDFSDAGRPPALSRTDLAAIVGGSNGTERVLAHDVESARFEDASGPPADGVLFFPLCFSITCARAVARPSASDEEKERFTMSTWVTPRSTRW